MSPHQLVALVRVAIAEAVAERLQGRHGGDRKTDQGGNISTLNDQGKARDLAAAKAGLGSGKTLEVLNGTKPCTGGYMVATWPQKRKTTLLF